MTEQRTIVKATGGMWEVEYYGGNVRVWPELLAYISKRESDCVLTEILFDGNDAGGEVYPTVESAVEDIERRLEEEFDAVIVEEGK